MDKEAKNKKQLVQAALNNPRRRPGGNSYYELETVDAAAGFYSVGKTGFALLAASDGNNDVID